MYIKCNSLEINPYFCADIGNSYSKVTAIRIHYFFEAMTIYVGNLNYKIREADLNDLFSDFGEVTSVKIVLDQETGRSKGFAFVEMADDAAANNAISKLNETSFFERNIIVNAARPKEKNFKPRNNEGGYNRRNNY